VSDQELELSGPDNDGWHTSNVMDWVPLCPQLGDSAVRLYWILRSLVIEKYSNPVRKLTLMELCYLLPAKPAAAGEPVKPSSVGRIRTLLRALTAVGLVTTPEGKRLTTSSRAKAIAAGPLRIRINDRPFPDYAGPRNAFAVLDGVREEAQLAAEKAAAAEAAREEQRKAEKAAADAATDVGQISDPQPPGQKSDPMGQESDPRGQISDPDSGPDLQDRDLPFSPSSQSSLSPPAPPPTTAPPEPDTTETREREAATPRRGGPTVPPQTPAPRPAKPAQSPSDRGPVRVDVQPVIEAFMRAYGSCPPRRLLDKIREQATELLSNGWPVDHVAALAAQLPGKGYTDLLRHAEHNPPPQAAPGRRRRKASLDCPTCKGSGEEEDPETFQPTGRPCPCLSNDVPAPAGR
jgi:hypothetical protein